MLISGCDIQSSGLMPSKMSNDHYIEGLAVALINIKLMVATDWQRAARSVNHSTETTSLAPALAVGSQFPYIVVIRRRLLRLHVYSGDDNLSS